MLTFVPTTWTGLNPLSFGSLGRTIAEAIATSLDQVLIPFHSGLWVEQAVEMGWKVEQLS